MKYPKDKLGNHIEILPGFAFKSKEFIDSGIPVIKIKNITPPSVSLTDLSYVAKETAKKQENFLLKYGDVLIALTGSHINQMASVVGRIARVRFNSPSLLNQRVAKITVKNPSDMDLDFVYYYLSQDEIKIALASKAGGAANQANISPSDVKSLEIPFPVLKTQRRIAAVLRNYDNLIENNQKQIKLLEEAAQRLYQEWFVKLRFPGHEKVKIVDGVPEGWKRKRLGDALTVVRGKSYSSKELSENDGVLMVNLSNIRPFGGYNRKQEKHFTGKYTTAQTVKTHDLIMGVTDMTQERRTVGRVALVPRLQMEAIISMDVIKLVPADGFPFFYYALLCYGGYSELISRFSNGTNVLHLRPDVLDVIDVLLPDKNLKKRYSEYFENIQDGINSLQDQIMLVTEARDRLLPKLMSGEIEV